MTGDERQRALERRVSALERQREDERDARRYALQLAAGVVIGMLAAVLEKRARR